VGRPRKPNVLKILEGAQPCRINADEPRPKGPIGDPPGPLDDVEAELAWDRLVDQLGAMGVATSADSDLVYLYAITYARWVNARRDLDDEGLTVGGQFGTKANPLISIVDRAQSQLVKILGQLGMTPASRSSLKASPHEEDDPLLAFIAAKSKSKSPHGKSDKAKA
jgi:P27 family predicted phage terminase small subunit